MKDLIKDANFPKTADGAVYHLGLKPGQLASRIITVGDPARARGIATLLDPLSSTSTSIDTSTHTPTSTDIGESMDITGDIEPPQPQPEPKLLEIHSERGFLTLTGKYKGVPVSIVAIGMGAPNMDFFVRECRETLDESGVKDMVIIRFGSCGGLVSELPVGSLAVPKAAIAINRNYDFDFVDTDETEHGSMDAYRISKPTNADSLLHQLLLETLRETLPSTVIKSDYMNASADSFYSSQGRITSFPDHNGGLIDKLVEMGVGSLEMETFHLLHLANSWPRRSHLQIQKRHATEEESQSSGSGSGSGSTRAPPPTNMPAQLRVLSSFENLDENFAVGHASPSRDEVTANGANGTGNGTGVEADEDGEEEDGPRIRAAAVQMIFAERSSRAFISPEEVDALQADSAKALLETLVRWKENVRSRL